MKNRSGPVTAGLHVSKSPPSTSMSTISEVAHLPLILACTSEKQLSRQEEEGKRPSCTVSLPPCLQQELPFNELRLGRLAPGGTQLAPAPDPILGLQTYCLLTAWSNKLLPGKMQGPCNATLFAPLLPPKKNWTGQN